jgi:hypothetical protein
MQTDLEEYAKNDSTLRAFFESHKNNKIIVEFHTCYYRDLMPVFMQPHTIFYGFAPFAERVLLDGNVYLTEVQGRIKYLFNALPQNFNRDNFLIYKATLFQGLKITIL